MPSRATIEMVAPESNPNASSPNSSSLAKNQQQPQQHAQQQPPPPQQKKQLPVIRSPFRSLTRLRKRRARSAPPVLRTPLIEHHYRVDTVRKVILPGVPKHEDDWARDTHDFFNLVVLIPIIALNVMNWNWDKVLNLQRRKTIADAWTGDWFDTFFMATMAYFVSDLLWILFIPKCVKSPITIVQHHIISMLFILVPYFDQEVQWCMGVCMSVEINTWFLIARRVFNKEGFPPWIIDLSFVSIRVKLISIGFYVTWILIRCILYPAMMVYMVERWWKETKKAGTSINMELIPPILHATFCALNFKWTYDLIMSKIRYYKRRNMQGSNKDPSVSKGL